MSKWPTTNNVFYSHTKSHSTSRMSRMVIRRFSTCRSTAQARLVGVAWRRFRLLMIMRVTAKFQSQFFKVARHRVRNKMGEKDVSEVEWNPASGTSDPWDGTVVWEMYTRILGFPWGDTVIRMHRVRLRQTIVRTDAWADPCLPFRAWLRCLILEVHLFSFLHPPPFRFGFRLRPFRRPKLHLLQGSLSGLRAL